MDILFKTTESFKAFFIEVGELSYFAGKFFKEVFKRLFKFKESLRLFFSWEIALCYEVILKNKPN
jgi:phospholipid/cholesterol/gamma-HCH transport system permease protein